jgi:hypothetical protein
MENDYKTKDLAEAGALIIKRQELLRVEKEGKICWFIFANNIECKKLSDQFFFGNLHANIREYHEILSRLKNKIFSM